MPAHSSRVLFFILFYLAVSQIVGPNVRAASFDTVNFASNLFFVSPIVRFFEPFGATATSLDIMPGTWSLNPEVWFYAMFPLVAFAVANRNALLSLAILGCLVAIGPTYRRSIGTEAAFADFFNFFGSADLFIFGMIAAVLSKLPWTPIGCRVVVGFAAALFVLVCSPLGYHFVIVDHFFTLGLACCLAIAALTADAAPAFPVLRSKFLTYSGHISYSLFLCHVTIVWYVCVPLSDLLGLTDPAARLAVNIGIGGAIAYAVSHVVYRTIELPWMRPEDGGNRPGTTQAVSAAAAAMVVLPIGLAIALMATGRGSPENYRPGLLSAMSEGILEAGLFGRRFVRTEIAEKVPGPTPVDSASRKPRVAASIDSQGRLTIAGEVDGGADPWVAVYLPVEKNLDVPEGASIEAEVLVRANRVGRSTLCVGIFNGRQDTCSAKVTAKGQHRLALVSRIRDRKFHAKLNIHPPPGLDVIDLTIVEFSVRLRVSK